MLYLLRGFIVAVAILAGASPASSGDIRVGFVNPNQPAEFWGLVSTTMRAAAAELGIDVDIRLADGSHDKAMQLARELLDQKPPLDYIIGTNDLKFGTDLIKLAEAAGVPLLLLSNDLDRKDWAEYGEPRSKYRHWLGSIVPHPESRGSRISEGILSASGRSHSTQP